MLPRSKLLAAAAALVVSGFAVPAAAQAAAVSVRVEAPGGPLVPKGDVTLPSAPVPAAGVMDGHTCPGNSVIGALDAATNGDWSGVWSDTTGWSIQRIKSLDLPDGDGRKRPVPQWLAVQRDPLARPDQRALLPRLHDRKYAVLLG